MKINNVLTLFNGISGCHLALDAAGIECNKVYYAEIDKFANIITEKHYPQDIPLGDVTKWEDWDLDWSSIDLVTAGFPCFTGETLVLTETGYKKISEVELGDKVLTHTNTWKPVTTLFEKENYIWEIKAQGLIKTNTTEEHPFLVSKMTRQWDSAKKAAVRVFSKPDWVEVKNLKEGDFVCYPKIKEEENLLNLSEEECYILGRYIADGHTRKGNRTEVGRENDRVWSLVLSVGSHKIPKIETKHTLHAHSKSTHRLVFSNKRLVEIAEKHCGCGAKEKYISPTLLKLPKNLLKVLIEGVLDGDGCEKQGTHKLTSVSLKLVNSMNLAVMKVYGVLGNIVFTKRPPTTIIEGRTVNQSDTYTLQFKKKPSKSSKFTVLEDYFAAPIKSIVKTERVETVYNIEVDVDNSYTVNNCIVHNCQSWSTAGQQLGDKDPRGMLFWTTLDIIKKVLQHNPKAKFMLENVKMKKDFETYITHHTTEALGYVEKTLINSALVSGQNRNRFYWTNFKVSQPEDKGILLCDILEDTVDSKYNLSKEAIDYMGRLRNGKPRWEYHKNPVNGKAACLTANMFKGVPYGTLRLENKSATKNGKAYTLTASQGNCVAWNSIERKQRTMIPVCESAEVNPNVYEGILYRKLTPVECERLQTFPDGWTEGISNTQRYKALGNSWTVDVIAHIFKEMLK